MKLFNRALTQRLMEEILSYKRNNEDDLYNILGCDELSSIEQINAEYKARVLECHPDKNPEDTAAAERFAKLQKAKEILTDQETRSKYDAWRGSGISMSFDQWMGLRSAVHTSLHWASVKKQPMLEHETTKDTVDSGTTNSCLSEQNTETHSYHQDIDSSSISHMSWSLRDKTDFGGISWQRDPASETLKKFRNYEI